MEIVSLNMEDYQRNRIIFAFQIMLEQCTWNGVCLPLEFSYKTLRILSSRLVDV